MHRPPQVSRHYHLAAEERQEASDMLKGWVWSLLVQSDEIDIHEPYAILELVQSFQVASSAR